MEIKKNPKSNLENYSKLFIQLGLVLALFITYVSIEKKTYDKEIANLGTASMSNEVDEETMITQRIEPPKVKPPPPPPAPEVLKIVKNDEKVVETVIESTETDETEAVKADQIVEASEDDALIEDVPFAIIEDVPIYPGCKGTRKQKSDCLNRKMRKLVQRYFDTDLASDLGLSPGKKRIFVQFKIGTDGNVTDIKVRAPHPRLKKEAIRVVKKFPKMIPGKQRGKPVRVSYTLPITFSVE